jgi:hypothetical protein
MINNLKDRKITGDLRRLMRKLGIIKLKDFGVLIEEMLIENFMMEWDDDGGRGSVIKTMLDALDTGEDDEHDR